jgi:N-acetyl sugar amidotransferase
MQFCNSCVTPITRPDLEFDDEGICDACRTAEAKRGVGEHIIDWDARKKDFDDLIEKCRSNDPEKYDCIIPVSGGKDSTWQLHVAKNIYGLRPLCLCFEPTLPTEIGRRNLETLNRMGVDLFHIKRNPLVYEKMVLEGFRRVGDMEWPNHIGIWTLPYRFAVAFDIPLILWGEGRMEYAGNFWIDDKHLREMDEEFINDFGCLNGLRAQDLVSEELGITMDDIKLYTMPDKQKLASVAGNKGCVGIFLGYYFDWKVREQVDYIEKNLGWERRKGRVETSYGDYESLDCLSMNLHDYLKYCKFGFGRATDEASRDVRDGSIDREQAVRLAEHYDGRYPQEAVSAFCGKLRITREEFDAICDRFTNRAIFESKNRKFIRDIDGSLVMKQRWIESRRTS